MAVKKETKRFCMLTTRKKPIWFVVPWRGPVTVHWFTGHKEQMSRPAARLRWLDLLACGFKPKPVPPPVF